MLGKLLRFHKKKEGLKNNISVYSFEILKTLFSLL